MIIFGISVFYFGLIDSGHFHCPQCGGDREFKHSPARRWFTLFFIPVIPLGKLGEVVTCQTCKTRFDPAVLRLPTSAQLSDSLATGMRAAASVVLQAGGWSHASAQVAIDLVRQAGIPDYDERALQADLGWPVESAAGPLQALREQLAHEARERFVTGAAQIALADGPLSPPEREGIATVAQHLGLTPAHTAGIIATAEATTRQQ